MKSRTQLSNFTFTFHFHALEKEMATHSSVLAWRIPRTAEPGGLPSMGSHRVGHDWSDLAAADRTGDGTTDWFQIRKGVYQGCILSPYLFNLYAEYMIQNAGLDEAQAAIKIAGRNINNLICRWHHPYGRKQRRTKRISWWKWKKRVKKLA